MTPKRTNLSLHKSKFHKSYLIEQEEGISLVDSALDLEKYEFPVNSQEDYFLYDIDEKEILQTFENVNEADLSNYKVKNLCLKGVYSFSDSFINIPSTIKKLNFQGGDYMPVFMAKSLITANLWMKIIYEAECYRFISSLQERLISEEKIRLLYAELRNLKIESNVNVLVEVILKSNITTLDMGWVYLADNDLLKLSQSKKLKSLSLCYIYNDNVLQLPKNLSCFVLYGSMVQKISQINFENLELEELYLEGNTINDLSDIKNIPQTLKILDFSNNLIKDFDLAALPNNLEILSLNGNRIENSFFEGLNKNVINKSVKQLLLSNNNLVINTWLLNRLTKTFPMLEFLELDGNIVEGIDEFLLINDEESSCIEKINFYLEIQDYKHDSSFEQLESVLDFYDRNQIVITWKHDMLPIKIILSDIQYVFNNYLKAMQDLKIFSDGLYCKIPHNDFSMLIRTHDEPINSISLELYANSNITFNTYFYKYFEEVKRLVDLNSHDHILPVAKFSEDCKVFESFYKKIFNIDKVLKENYVIIPDEEILVLVRNLKRGELEKSKLKKEKFYKKVKDVAFVIITGKNAFPFVLNKDLLINNIEENHHLLNHKDYYDISLRSSEDKTLYLDSLQNEYLGQNRFRQGIVFADHDSTQKITVCYNPAYFDIIEDEIICLNLKIAFSESNLISPIVGSRKLNLNLKENKITLKYTGIPASK